MTDTTGATTGERPTFDQEFDEDLWSEVLPGLWQGGTHDDDVRRGGRRGADTVHITKDDFDFVTTLYAWAMPVDWFVREIRFGIYDSHDGMDDFETEELFDVVRSTHRAWKKGDKTLIRCQAGWNRSGLVTALVLIREGYDAQDAIDLIRRTRSKWALCNDSFVDWLHQLDAAEIRA